MTNYGILNLIISATQPILTEITKTIIKFVKSKIN